MAKIPFDIKYRPQIESGEYKVETRNGRPVRIVCWDRKHGYPIVGLAYEKATGCESYINAYVDGTTSANGKMELSDDLFLITPEPEFSEMEGLLLSWLSDDTKGEIQMDRMKEVVKNRASELLELVKKESLRILETCKENADSFTDEDERIIRDLLDFLDNVWHLGRDANFDKWGKADCADWMSWLEKQKEQKHEDIMDEFTRNIRNLITDKLTVHTKGLDGSEVSSTVFIDDKTAKDIASGILFYVGKEAIKNPNREIPEWSEEDEIRLKEALEVLNESIKYLPFGYGYTKDVRLVTDWLKSLRPQPQRRDTYYDIIHSILDMLKDKDFTQITPGHRVSLLNDIRVKCKIADECAEILDEPSWKPSEEQMEALERASTNEYLSTKQFDILVSLYEQLKNL